MTLDSALFSTFTLMLLTGLYAAVVALAVWLAPWRKLRDGENLNVLLGAVVALMLLWHLSPEVQPGLSFHLLGLTAVTLMFGWSFAVLAAMLAQIGVLLNLGGPWHDLVLNGLIAAVVPITLTQIMLVLIRTYLPKHFFVYVLVNGFLTAGIVGTLGGYLATLALVGSGAYTFAELDQTVLPFFPLMFFPEAFLNGAIMTVLVAFRPEWVYSFSDEQYLKGK